jgi:HPt (histidine-containing phosphotransfer) domain-containing protein
MAEDADIASAAIDAARIAAVSAAVGPLRLRELIVILVGRVETLVAAAEMFPEGAKESLPALHKSWGSAASLGFPALADGLARMETDLRRALVQAQTAERDLASEWDIVRQSARALPGLCKDAVQSKEALRL